MEYVHFCVNTALYHVASDAAIAMRFRRATLFNFNRVACCASLREILCLNENDVEDYSFRVATHLENLKKSGNLKVVREYRKSGRIQGKCVLAYGQLP